MTDGVDVNSKEAALWSENMRLRSALEWVLPIAEIGLEHCRQERLRAGHKFGTKRMGLHDFEMAGMENARAALTSGELP